MVTPRQNIVTLARGVVIILAVAAIFAYWESSVGNGHLFWFVIGFGMFAVVAMWVFPEAMGKTDDKKKP